MIERLDGLIDHRIEQISHKQAPVDEVMKLKEPYRSKFMGWNAEHFHGFYTREGDSRSYTWG